MFSHGSLNRCYQLIWNHTLQMFVVVAETARRHGRRSHRIVRVFSLAAGCVLATIISPLLHAADPTTVIPVEGNTKAYFAPNGVPVVDINTANAAGLSHNKYTKYNVDAKGLVLNNGNSSKISRQSQLAGQVYANTNLVNQASLILNEVVAANRSKLAGYTEVLGGKADVVVANPYGISCSGCGFINTDRVTLSTGVPFLNGDGSLGGFNVNSGDILINGNGLNATAQQILDLVSRSVVIDGQINANDLSITAGAVQWDYAGRQINEGETIAGEVTYAIDSSVLGGMYANRIKIISNDAGVGVRMLGEVAATADDFTLDASGKIVLQNKISAERDIRIGSGGVGSDTLVLSNAELTAKNNLELAAADGAIFSGGVLLANNNLNVLASSLVDMASNLAITDNNKRFAGQQLQLDLFGDSSIDGTSWGGNKGLTINSDDLTIGSNGATLYSNNELDLNSTGNLNLNSASVYAVNDLNLSATGAVATTAGVNQGIQTDNGNLFIFANGFNNAGSVSADNGLLTANINGVLTNTGTLHSANSLSISDKTSGSAVDVSNSGQILSDGTLTIQAKSITNSGSGLIQTSRGGTVTAASLINTGNWLSSTTDGYQADFVLDTLTNTGVLQSADNLSLLVKNVISNGNKILAEKHLLIDASVASNLSINNQSGAYMQAGDLLRVRGTQWSSVDLVNQSGFIVADQLELGLGNLTNAGTLQANTGNGTVEVANALTNSGNVLMDIASISANALNNNGVIQFARGGSVYASSLTNTGNWLVSTTSGYSASFYADTLNNSGTIQSSDDLSITVIDSLANTGTLLAVESLTFDASGAGPVMVINNNAGGVIQGGDYLQIADAGGGGNITLNNSANGKIIANSHYFHLTNLTNDGVIQGGTAATILRIINTLSNNNGAKLILSTSNGGSGTITANNLINAGTLQSKGNATFGLGGFTNSGTVIGNNNLTFLGASASSYTFTNTNRIQAGGLLDIKGYNSSNQVNVTLGGSSVTLGNTLDILANSFTIDNGGMLTSTAGATLNFSTLSFGGTTSRIVLATGGSGNATLTLANSFSNPGAIHSGYDLAFTAPSITNTNTGGISALHNLTVTANSGNISNAGAMYAGNLLTGNATGTFTNVANTGTLDSSGSMSFTANTFINNYMMNASQNITISAAIFKNEVPGGDTRAWYPEGVRSTELTSYTSQGYNGCGCVDQTEWWWYKDTWTQDQYYVGGAPSYKPEIIAGNTLTIQNFNTGTNIGGILSANTVNVFGNGGASFTNDSLSLLRRNYYETYRRFIEYIAAGPAKYTDDYRDYSGSIIDSTVTLSSFGAGVFANTLNVSNVALTNAGSPYAADPNSTTESGSSAIGNVGEASGANPVGSINGVSGVAATAPISFAGLNLQLPSNPNGYFVVSKNPESEYLIETNPLFAVGSDYVGSNYLEERYGYNPDLVIKKLGDANYEAFLMRQQLIQQLGTNLMFGYESEAEQMRGLMDNALNEGTRLGLVYGKAPTSEQLANLQQDMVWMVETTVNGQKVLAPVVYLSAATKAGYESGGAVIAANNANMNLDSLTNTGGTIQGRESLNVTSKGDITNTSGTIKGGDVSLQSTEGNIVNQTLAETTGGDKEMRTVIGKQAGIESTGNLNVDAAKNITNLGATMSAGGDASLKAGENITFDTIENKNTSTTYSSSDNGLTSTTSSTTTSTTQQIKSGLTVGGNLDAKAENDITFAGTDVKAGGDANLDAGGNVNVLSRADSKTVTSSSATSGIGVGGGVAGVETTESLNFKATNVGSTIDIGGNANVKAGEDITLQGSTVNVGGNADLDAKNINVLAGKDEEYSTSKTTTQTFMKVDSGSSESSSGTSSSSGAEAGGVAASAGAEAGAEANANASGGVKFSETTTTTSETYNSKNVGSAINVGGNLNMNADETVTVQGSNIAAGGNVDVKATDVKVLAGQDVSYSNTSTSTTSVGLMASSENNANAKAGANAGADAGSLNAGAEAGAEANASSNNNIALGKQENTSTTELNIKNTGSSITSGGNMSVDASNKLTTQGSSLESGGDMNLKAKEMEFLAADDVNIKTTTSSTTEVGIYVDANAGANAGADAGIGGTNLAGGANAGAEAKAEASAGLYGSNTTTSTTEGSTTAVTSSIKSGGNMTRETEGKITDVGTQIEAGGDFTQSANEIDSRAARNTTFSSTTSETNSAKVGVYADAGANASASADTSGAAGAGAGANASIGGKASYENNQSSSSSNSSEAVTSNIKAGGNFSSTSKEKTSLEGTNIEAGGNAALNAGSLDFKAAENTSSSTSTESNANAELKVGKNFGSDGPVKLDASGGYETQTERESSSQAVTGSIKSGGNLSVNTTGDARFEGTNLDAGKDASIKTGGDLKFDAARDTQTSSSEGFNVEASINLSKNKTSKEGGVEVGGDYNQSSSESSQAVVGGIKSGGNLKIDSGNNASFEGTNIEAGRDAEIGAKNNLEFNAARDTEKSESFDVSASVGVGGSSSKNADGGSSSSSSVGVNAEANYEKSDSSTAKAGSIKTGNNLKLSSGNDTTLEGTNVDAGGKASIDAGGNVNMKAAESTSSSVSVGVGIGGETSQTTNTDAQGTKTKEPRESSGDFNASLSGSAETTREGGSINAGKGIDINAGKNANFEGTKISSGGDTNVAAGGDVNFKAAKSTSISGEISGGSTSGLNSAEIGGGVSNQGVDIKTDGNLNVKSGGKTTMEGTQGSAGGKINIDAKEGVEKKSTVSASGEIGVTKADASVDVQKTELKENQR